MLTQRLDRYILASAVPAFLATAGALVLLFASFELLLKIEGYLRVAKRENTDSLQLTWWIVQFYSLSIPNLFVTMAPFFTVISGMFTVSRFLASNELAPMLFTGRSIFRVLRPLLLMGLGSALTMGLLWQFVIPACSEYRADLYKKLKGVSDEVTIRNGLFRSKQHSGRIVFCKRYRHGLQRMEGVIVHGPGTDGVELYLEASAAEWDPQRLDWELINGRLQTGDEIHRQEWLGMPALTPTLVQRSTRQLKEALELSYTDLVELREAHPHRQSYTLALYHHFTFPLANLVLLLLVLPFGIHFDRGGKIERVALAIAVCGGYMFVDLTCQNLGHREFLDPVAAAWVPTILFGSLGIASFTGIRS